MTILGHTVDLQFIIATLLGTGAAICSTLSFQQKENKRLFFLQLMASAFFGIQYILLGFWSGPVFNAIACVRSMILYKGGKMAENKKLEIGILGALAVAYICILIFLHEWQATFSFLAMSISTISMWSKSGKKIRLVQMFVISPCWIVFDILSGSIAGLVSETIAVCSVIISIMRYGINGFDEGKKNG